MLGKSYNKNIKSCWQISRYAVIYSHRRQTPDIDEEANKMFYEIEIEDTVKVQYMVTDRTESSELEIPDDWDI